MIVTTGGEHYNFQTIYMTEHLQEYPLAKAESLEEMGIFPDLTKRAFNTVVSNFEDIN